jgi:3-oxo-4,17-pregnadiene-20-carboxyl-CoA hydratase beta subunit
MTAQAGAVLPELVIEVTPTFVISTAIATRDFQDVHHDRDKAVERGSKDIFLNILTTTGLVQRYVTDWAGPRALVRHIAIRLGVPCYAGDTLTFSGQVTAAGNGALAGDERPGDARPAGERPAGERSGDERSGGEYVVRVVGRCSLGDHVTGTVRLQSAG